MRIVIVSIITFLLASMTFGIFGVLTDGSEVRLVSPDLTMVYSTAKVVGNNIQFDTLPPPGAEIRVLVFPPESLRDYEPPVAAPTADEEPSFGAAGAQARSAPPATVNIVGPQAFRAVVTVTQDDILVYVNNQLTSFRDVLTTEYGVRLTLPGD